MSSSTLVLPAPDQGWVLYSAGSEIGRGEDLRALVGNRADVVIGLPASLVSTFVVDLPRVEDALHESMIFAQIEKRGLAGKGGFVFDYELIHPSDQGDTFAVQVIADLPAELIVPVASGYNTSASLLKTGPVTLLREQGRLVLAVVVGGVPAHFQVLNGKPDVGRATAQEINLLLLGLKGESFLGASPIRELVLAVPGVEEKELIEFRSALSLPVSVVSGAPAAGSGEGRPRLTPSAVLLSRKKRRSAVRNIVLLAAGLILYAVIGVWVWKDAQSTKREIASLEHQISIIEPDVQRIQLAEQRWRVLEPAFEKNYFPVVQLSRITAALPGSGVVIREYRTSGRNVRVRGQARDVQLANRLLEDLQGIDGFEAYEWSMPNPKVEKNNTATFEIEGKLKNAGADS
jgi:Tfp pilus assembly protein PilN